MYLIIIIVELKNAVNMNCDNLCNPCVTAKCLVLPVCGEVSDLLIGQFEAETLYQVHIKNMDSGVERVYDITTGISGELIFELVNAEGFVNSKSLFRLWVTEANEPIDINIEDASVPCLTVTFQNIYDNEGFPIAPENQTIKL